MGERGVSIPFKRETAFKQTHVTTNAVVGRHVSIPFKRETAFKHTDRWMLVSPAVIPVSIPFKRETAFKPGPHQVLSWPLAKFQFPSNGKLHSNNIQIYASAGVLAMFQFPSNGKLHSNNIQIYASAGVLAMFQFPSNGKLHSNQAMEDYERRSLLSFNSLQTGNCIQTEEAGRQADILVQFQFPSNGKLHSNSALLKPIICGGQLSFNSLQTGNCIQTIFDIGESALVMCFNSLQTGNCIQTYRWQFRRRWRIRVSIPFKRETAFKQT